MSAISTPVDLFYTPAADPDPRTPQAAPTCTTGPAGRSPPPSSADVSAFRTRLQRDELPALTVLKARPRGRRGAHRQPAGFYFSLGSVSRPGAPGVGGRWPRTGGSPDTGRGRAVVCAPGPVHRGCAPYLPAKPVLRRWRASALRPTRDHDPLQSPLRVLHQPVAGRQAAHSTRPSASHARWYRLSACDRRRAHGSRRVAAASGIAHPGDRTPTPAGDSKTSGSSRMEPSQRSNAVGRCWRQD